MAENMENQEVIDVTEEKATGLATTASVQTEPEEATTNKVGLVGKICAVTAVVSGLIALATKGYQKGKLKSKKTSSEDAEPTNSEDEVSE